MADNRYERITYLFRVFADGSISRKEYEELTVILNVAGNDDEIFTAMNGIWNDAVDTDYHTEADRDIFYQRLINSKEFKEKSVKLRSIKPWYRYAAAVLLIALSAAAYLFFQSQNQQGVFTAKNDIAPGKNKAILTLANGSKISLTDAKAGKITNQYGVTILKNASGQLEYKATGDIPGDKEAALYNNLEVPYGGQYQLSLPDGTRVWLNAGSSLKYPVKFSGQERQVTLTGEAYFEVAKNKTMPFKVKTAKQVVEVLGTHFNINAYSEEPTVKTTLLEGSVKVTPATSLAFMMLKPGEQSVLENNKLEVKEADTEEAIAWKNGLFLFNSQTLGEIMRQVARWYDLQIVFDDAELKSQRFGGSISRFKNVSQLLQVLESTGSVHFKIEGRRLTAMK